jgi:hypothetical protein
MLRVPKTMAEYPGGYVFKYITGITLTFVPLHASFKQFPGITLTAVPLHASFKQFHERPPGATMLYRYIPPLFSLVSYHLPMGVRV